MPLVANGDYQNRQRCEETRFSETYQACGEQKHGPGKWSHKSFWDVDDNENYSVTLLLHACLYLIDSPVMHTFWPRPSGEETWAASWSGTFSSHYSLPLDLEGHMIGIGPLMLISCRLTKPLESVIFSCAWFEVSFAEIQEQLLAA